jgi:hypothetical protein
VIVDRASTNRLSTCNINGRGSTRPRRMDSEERKGFEVLLETMKILVVSLLDERSVNDSVDNGLVPLAQIAPGAGSELTSRGHIIFDKVTGGGSVNLRCLRSSLLFTTRLWTRAAMTTFFFYSSINAAG